jgi:hypothetical protein
MLRLQTSCTGLLCGAVLAAFAPATVSAQASDNAGNPPYADGWQTGDNGGTGFAPWMLSGPGNGNSANGGFFIGNANTNGSPNNAAGQPTINTGGSNSGVSFGLYANSGQTVTATRPFSSSLNVFSTFSLGFDNGFIDAGSSTSFSLATPTTTRFTFTFIGGNSNYSINDSAGLTSTGLPGFSSSGFNTAFLLTGPDTYSFTLTRLSDNATFTRTGTLIGTGAIDRVIVGNVSAGSGDTNNLFVNNLNIVNAPEPGSVALLGIGFAGIAGVYRRRKG